MSQHGRHILRIGEVRQGGGKRGHSPRTRRGLVHGEGGRGRGEGEGAGFTGKGAGDGGEEDGGFYTENTCTWWETGVVTEKKAC